MLIQELKAILQGEAHIFKDTYFECSQIHLLTIMYQLKLKNCDTFRNFLFQSFCKLLLRASNLHQYYVPDLSDCRSLLFQVMMFHSIFPNIHIFITIRTFQKRQNKLIIVVVRKIVSIKKLFF